MTQIPLDPWTSCPLACFDLETDGPDPTQARVVTGYVARIDGAKVQGNHWVLNTGRAMPDEAAAIHGYTTERMQAEGLDYEEGMVSMWAALQLLWADGCCVATFNGSYDATVMIHELRRLGYKNVGDVGLMFDGLCIDKHFDQFRKGSRKLVDVVEHYGLSMGNAHAADADALAAARLAWKMPRVYPELAKMTGDELQANQAQWYREQRLSFIEYRKRKGQPVDDVSTDWPVRAA